MNINLHDWKIRNVACVDFVFFSYRHQLSGDEALTADEPDMIRLYVDLHHCFMTDDIVRYISTFQFAVKNKYK